MAKIKKKIREKGKKSFIAWMLVVGVLLISSYAAFLGIRSKPPKKVGAYGHTSLQNTEVEDPVCKMMVKPPAEGHIEYRAKQYFFCSKTCKDEFEKEPGKYLR